jgi:hypothetical protein
LKIACGNHFDPLSRHAATRIQVVFEHYGNLTVKPYDEETVYKGFVDELNQRIGKYNNNLSVRLGRNAKVNPAVAQ